MAFSTATKHCPTSTFFTTAMGLVVLLAICMISSAAPANKRQAMNSESDLNTTHIKQTFWGMELFTEIDQQGAQEAKNLYNDISLQLQLEVLCNMHDLYRDYTTFLSTPDDPLHATYSGNQYVAWKAMQSACQWVNSTSNLFVDDGCTLTSIARKCYAFHLHNVVQQKLHMRESQQVGTSVPSTRLSTKWITHNGLPGCGDTVIEDAIN